jgi:hypothetical protein
MHVIVPELRVPVLHVVVIQMAVRLVVMVCSVEGPAGVMPVRPVSWLMPKVVELIATPQPRRDRPFGQQRDDSA